MVHVSRTLVLRDADDDWVCVQSIRGFSTSMRWLHNQGSVGIRNAGMQILIGDRHTILRVLLIANKDSLHGVSW